MEGSSEESRFKRTADDFIFLKILGEGSFSRVYLARDIHNKRNFAIKVCDKAKIKAEQMQTSIFREKNIMRVLSENSSPFFVKLWFTFHNSEFLYFGLNYCPNGELLSFINQRDIFDNNAVIFYSAEILLALEHLHKLGIIHRDLKPENILLNENMHIQVTDFGSAWIKDDPYRNENLDAKLEKKNRKNSFVGTAQYVSPEMLTNKEITYMCDIWAYGVIVYQMITGTTPFSGSNDYFIFQKIHNLEYTFPEHFPSTAKELVESMLKHDPESRLGAQDNLDGGYHSIREHLFFEPLHGNWNLIDQQPPSKMLMKAMSKEVPELDQENFEPGLGEKQMARLFGLALNDNCDLSPLPPLKKGLLDFDENEFERRLEKQRREHKFHRFVDDNLILRESVMEKRRDFMSKKRHFLLTTGPQLYYVDPDKMVLKGKIIFCKSLKTWCKNFKCFYIQVPNRTYVLEDEGFNAPAWCNAINELRDAAFDHNKEAANKDYPLKKPTGKNSLKLETVNVFPKPLVKNAQNIP